MTLRFITQVLLLPLLALIVPLRYAIAWLLESVEDWRRRPVPIPVRADQPDPALRQRRGERGGRA